MSHPHIPVEVHLPPWPTAICPGCGGEYMLGRPVSRGVVVPHQLGGPEGPFCRRYAGEDGAA